MIDLSTIIVIIIFFLNIIMFILGYFLGKINNISYGSSDNFYVKTDKINKKNTENISIDEGKIVTKIDTSNLEKKYDKLGDDKVSEENISSSINKLKSMKK